MKSSVVENEREGLNYTGTQGAEAKVMDAGADDYIRKPLEPKPFLSRIKAVLRRSAM